MFEKFIQWVEGFHLTAIENALSNLLHLCGQNYIQDKNIQSAVLDSIIQTIESQKSSTAPSTTPPSTEGATK